MQITTAINRTKQTLFGATSIAPLVFFRIAFGCLMLFSCIRFSYYGWIDDFYVEPKFFFPFLGFEWVKPFSRMGMYLLFFGMGLSALFIALGFLYRFATVFFFAAFTYVELIDKTYYLNHYYFVSIVAFLMIFLPAHRFFSVDAKLFPQIKSNQVSRWCIMAIQLQLGIVYFFAGIAKINYDWLIEAQPLRIWLASKSYMPIIGNALDEPVVAYFFSWAGCIYDLTIVFFLINKRTRKWAYLTVVVFHVLTWLLFPIGIFPWIMIVATMIFFDKEFHQQLLNSIAKLFKSSLDFTTFLFKPVSKTKKQIITLIIGLHFLLQLLLPFRYLLYPGNLFWTEEGFRFSWRVMLMEKAGSSLFYVSDAAFPGEIEINNRLYLTRQQELMMSTQPDMILQFAHFLRDEYQDTTITIKYQSFHFSHPEVRVRSFVSLNGKGSKAFIDPTVNLAQENYNLYHRTWVLNYE